MSARSCDVELSEKVFGGEAVRGNEHNANVAPATGTALIVLLAFVLPGFVVVLFQERTFKKTEDIQPFDRLLRVAYYSVWCYLLLAAVALVFGIDRPAIERLYHRYEGDPAHLVWRGALAVLVPASLVWLGTVLAHELGITRRVLEAVRLNGRHLEQTAWDFWFGRGLKGHVRIVYANGRSVWGYYGEESFASYAKDGRDVFLEHIYDERVVDDDGGDSVPGAWFGKAHEANRGGWVNLEDAVSIEIYDFENCQGTTLTVPRTKRRPWTRASRSATPDKQSSVDSGPGASATSTSDQGVAQSNAEAE